MGATMKKIVLALAMGASLSSFATTHMMMYADNGDFTMYGALTAGSSPMEGTFKSSTYYRGICEGARYQVIPGSPTKIAVSFPEGKCRTMSMEITIAPEDYPKLMSGQRISAQFTSPEFFGASKDAHIEIVNQSQP
jgi:hypothetical protein